MARSNWAQYGFHAGELSPKLEMRDDVTLRKFGVDKLINWTINLQGPVTTSRGLEHTVNVGGPTGRIFPFPVSVFTGFTISVSPTAICIVNQDGLVYADQLVANWEFDSGSQYWTTDVALTGAALFVAGSVNLAPGVPVGAYAGISQNVAVTANETNELEIQIVDGVGPMEVSVGTAAGLDDILAETTYLGDSTVTISGLSSPTTDFFVNIRVNGSEAAKRLASVSVLNTDSEPVHVTFPSPWTDASALYTVQAKMAPGTQSLYFVGGGVAPYMLSHDRVTHLWTFVPVPLTNVPPEWAGTNWPMALDFFQGRLYLGGAPEQPEDVWATRPGSYDEATDPAFNWNKFEDLLLKGTDASADAVNADHAINYTMDRRGAIRWIMSQKNLVIGTENSEHIITAVDGVVIPGDIQSTLQSSFGSALSQAVNVGNEIMWLSTDRTKIRSMGYEFSRQQFVAKDITFLAEHMPQSPNHMTEIHYSANPRSLILCPTNAGNGILCAYDAETRQGGFFRREMLGGTIISSCVLPFFGRDEIWILVDRGAEGGMLSLEKSVAGPNIKLDNYETLFSGNGPVSAWSAPHLANTLCQALADDAVHPDILVEADGSFVTEEPASKVTIGIQMISTMVTMSLGTTVQYVGTARPMTKRFNKLYARITASWMPILNGKRPPTRHPATPMGEMEPPRTETIKVANLGWDRDGRISVVQDLPVPTEVAGIFGELSQEQL